MKKILLIDNNDSFTYNLVQILEENSCLVDIVENQNKSEVMNDKYSGIVISPGPGNPSEYKMLFDFLEENWKRNKILGVCLGHQVIGEFFGAKNIQLAQVHHGERSQINITSDSLLFRDILSQEPLLVGRYHSWALSKDEFPEDLTITSVDENGTIMSIEHKRLPIFGVQFHLESIMTQAGEKMIRNWLDI